MPAINKNWTDAQVEQVSNNILPEGKNYAQCSYFCRRYLGKGFKPVKAFQVVAENSKAKEYAEMHKSGMSYAEIAKQVGLSRQRVGLLVKNWISKHPE